MEKHKNVLLVTNSITKNEITLIKQAVSNAQDQALKIKLSIVNVIPNLPTCYFNIPSMVVLAENYYEEAKNTLSSIGETLNIPGRDQWLITGRIRTEVLRLASKLDTNFILASSTNIQDFHKSFSFIKRDHGTTPVRSISSLVHL